MSMKANKLWVDATQSLVVAYGTIDLAGSYVTNGVTLDLSKLGIPAALPPVRVEIWSQVSQGAAALKDFYTYIPGTAQSDGKVQVVVNNAEMAATAFATTTPTNASGLKLLFRAEFIKNL